MKKITLTISNDMDMLSPVLAAASKLAANLTFGKRESAELELILEEALSNVIQYEFLPGQDDNVIVEMEAVTLGMSIRILSKGIPPDVEKIHSLESQDPETLAKDGFHGLGVFLIRHLADEVTYLNLGREGQEIRILKYRSQETPGKPAHQEHIEHEETVAGKEIDFYIRRMLGEEAPIITKLAYAAYNLSYVYDQVYFPERVRDLNASDEMMSFVAVSKGTEEIMGHCALVRDEDSDMIEMAVAFVNPDYRGSGCLNKLSVQCLDEVRNLKIPAVFVHAVTVHPYSQKAAYSMGLKEAALMISRVTVLEMSKIEGSSHFRESLVFQLKYMQKVHRGKIFIPEHHREMMTAICENIGLEVGVYCSDPETGSLAEEGAVESRSDHYLGGHIFVRTFGKDTEKMIAQSLRTFCLARTETIYLYLPMQHAASINNCIAAEKLGFFFGGLRPGHDGTEWLLLQYLNNQSYPYDKLKFCSPFGQRLCQYIQEHDPSYTS